MKLLLTSNGWEKNLEIKKEFLKLVDKKPSDLIIFLINTATREDKDWKYVRLQIKELVDLGIKKKHIRVFSLNNKVKQLILKDIDIFYVCGGNTFHYLYKMRKTGLDRQIKKLVKKGVSYFGISAGSILAGPRIDIAGIGDGDKNDIKLKNLNGLGITDVIVFPHYLRRDEKLVKKFEEQNKCRVFRLTDKQALLVKGKIKKIIK